MVGWLWKIIRFIQKKCKCKENRWNRKDFISGKWKNIKIWDKIHPWINQAYVSSIFSRIYFSKFPFYLISKIYLLSSNRKYEEEKNNYLLTKLNFVCNLGGRWGTNLLSVSVFLLLAELYLEISCSLSLVVFITSLPADRSYALGPCVFACLRLMKPPFSSRYDKKVKHQKWLISW